MKTNLKKVLAVVLSLMMCMSALALFASADTATPVTPTIAKTVYLSSTGNDENDGLTKATAVKSLVKASEKLETLGGEIIVLDDMTIENPNMEKEYLLYFALNYSTVYLHGEKQADGSYPRLKFVMNKKILRWEMSSPFAIYDIELETDLGAAMVFVGNCYRLTIGENVTCVNAGTAAEAGKGTHSKFMIFGAQFNISTSAPLCTEAQSPFVSVMSGNWAEVWADGNAKSNWIVKNPTLNFLGGVGHEVKPCHADKETQGTVTANIWGGQITKLSGYGGSAAKLSHVLNLYNGAEAGIETMSSAYTEAGTSSTEPATINKLTGTAPTFYELAECKLTPPKPPVFEDEDTQPSGGNSGNETEVPTASNNPTDTKAPDTSKETAGATDKPGNTDEKKGCSSFIATTGIFAMAVLAGTAVAVCTKKKEQ